MSAYKDILAIWNAETPQPAVEFLVGQGALKDTIPCRTCSEQTTRIPVTTKTRIDGCVYRCQRSTCNNRTLVSIRHSSPFFKKFCKTRLQDLIYLIYLWALEESVKIAVTKSNLSKKTVIAVFRELRGICAWKLEDLLNKTGPTLGGPGQKVEIDESCFSYKRKYQKGRSNKPCWVFGLVDRSTSPALGVMKIVEKRDASTLLPIIKQHVIPGTKVVSDEWKAYNHVDDLPGIEHGTVNHSKNFVCYKTGNHTQAIESYWAQTKYKLKKMKGVRRVYLAGYLEEKQWRDRFGRSNIQAFETILSHLSLRYL